ncbi:hypothetical protein NP493_1440g00008 [Ridgeia piscesae]|uniref:G-protein coupled receptors family 2 profile 2 domain-containing protein n=1 Tax=Ridgeia piscesae TaxID=27915 RepID=A0AAD9K2B3_RIDPI|nr:hypothetical protein NP493_1440g00008 [Ridgeia piscesae]
MMSPARRMLLHCLLIVAAYADSPVGQRPTSSATVNTDARPAVVNDEHGPRLLPDAEAAKGSGSPVALNSGSSTSIHDQYSYTVFDNDNDDDSTTIRNEDNHTINVTHKPLTIRELENFAYDVMCKTSCEHKCGLRVSLGDSHCYCDWACVQLGDCCLDYEAACLSSPNVTRDNYADILRGRKSRTVDCVNIQLAHPKAENRGRLPDTLLMVSSCGSATTTDPSTVRLCQRSSMMNRTLATETPVMFRDVIYRNKYCAVCNNPGDTLTHMTTAGVVFTGCLNATGNASDLSQRNDTGTMEYQAISECEIIKFKMGVLENLWRDVSRYSCTSEGNGLSVCSAESTYPQFDSAHLLSTCHKYRADISHSGISYKNPHCAICSGMTDIHNLQCFRLTISHVMGIQDMIIFVGHERQHTFTYNAIKAVSGDVKFNLCSFDMMLGRMSGTCCPAGYVAQRDNLCTMLNVNVPQILSTKRDVKIYLILSTQQEQLERFDHERLIQYIGVDIVENSTRRGACSSFQMLTNWNYATSNSSTCWCHETVSRNVLDVITRIELFASSMMIHIVEQFNIFVLNQDANDTTVSCLSGSKKIQRQGRLLRATSAPFPTTFSIWATSLVYDINDVPIIMSWPHDHFENVHFHFLRSLVCEPDVFSCDTVTFQADDYKYLNGTLVLFEGSRGEMKIPEITVLKLDSDAIVMCKSQLSNITVIQRKSTYRNGKTTSVIVKETLTMIGNILSLICLAFTITTYCMFGQIRTRAGKCIMNLCGALFCAQLSLQVNDHFVPCRAACVAVAVFQHYTWLVAFLWMNVLAFDVSCTFSHMKPSSGGRQTSRLRAFALYAWGLPAVFVALCLVLDLCTDLPFNYGGETMCWLAGPRSVVYYFAAPLAAILAANVMLFVRAVVALRRTTAIANRARQPRQEQSTFFVYIRLTSLMGFTWLFGFLANVDVLSFLWYPFIVCNTCQGVFICVSFTLTSTVRRLWRVRCCGDRSRSPNCTDPSHDIHLKKLVPEVGCALWKSGSTP